MLDKLHHYTHIDNLNSILNEGLLPYNAIKNKADTKYFYKDRNDLRKEYILPSSSASFYDYTSFYLYKRNPFIDNLIKSKIFDQKYMIFLSYSIDNLFDSDSFLTIGDLNNCKFTNDFSKLPELFLDSSFVKEWNPSKRRLENQEFLDKLASCAYSKASFPSSKIIEITVFNQEAKDVVLDILDLHGIKDKIPVILGTYYDYFLDMDEKLYYHIIGPEEIYKEYLNFINNVLPEIKHEPNAQFKNIKALNNALDLSLSNLPETSELIGLETFNKVHTENVGNHTKTVVNNLKNAKEYNLLSNDEKELVKLAAYLHDIGKGPKKRWLKSDKLQLIDPNHPIKSMKMLKEIFQHQLCEISPYEMTLLSKLLCYHDLIGDMASKGRHSYELYRIISNINEYYMLLTLSKGDISSIREEWITMNEAFFDALTEKMKKLC